MTNTNGELQLIAELLKQNIMLGQRLDQQGQRIDTHIKEYQENQKLVNENMLQVITALNNFNLRLDNFGNMLEKLPEAVKDQIGFPKNKP